MRAWSLLSVCLCLCVCVVPSVWGQTDNGFTPVVDRVSARTARVRWLINTGASTLVSTIVQYTNVSTEFAANPNTFHFTTCGGGSACPTNPDDHDIVLTQGSTPITSNVLRGLNPSTSYQVRLGYLLGSNPVVQPTSATAYGFNTPALSDVTTLSTLLVSGGCGQLNADNSNYYLNVNSGAGTTVYSCDVVAETANVTITIVPAHAYAVVNSTSPSPTLAATSLPLSVSSVYADPLTQYNTTLILNGAGSGVPTNFSWNVTSESGVVQTYVVSIRRAGQLDTAQIAGPTSPIVAMITSPATSTLLQYRALTWSNTVIKSWRAWSDDLTTFPYSGLTLTGGILTSANTNTLTVTPVTASVPDGSCSNVYVALFDTNGNSFRYTTCISALSDYCSTAPFGAATNWQNPWGPTNSQITPLVLPASTSNSSQLYFPAPPYPTFPIA